MNPQSTLNLFERVLLDTIGASLTLLIVIVIAWVICGLIRDWKD